MLNLSDKKMQKNLSKGEFGYDVAFATKKYHLVRHRNLYGNEDGVQLLLNEVSSPTRLPSVKMHL